MKVVDFIHSFLIVQKDNGSSGAKNVLSERSIYISFCAEIAAFLISINVTLGFFNTLLSAFCFAAGCTSVALCLLWFYATHGFAFGSETTGITRQGRKVDIDQIQKSTNVYFARHLLVFGMMYISMSLSVTCFFLFLMGVGSIVSCNPNVSVLSFFGDFFAENCTTVDFILLNSFMFFSFSESDLVVTNWSERTNLVILWVLVSIRSFFALAFFPAVATSWLATRFSGK